MNPSVIHLKDYFTANSVLFMLQGKLCSLGAKISDLSDVVRRKRMELEYLKRIETLTTVVESQVRLKFDTYIFIL